MEIWLFTMEVESEVRSDYMGERPIEYAYGQQLGYFDVFEVFE